MAIKVKEKDWNNKAIRDAVLQVAQLFDDDIEVKKRKVKFKPYNVQIWLNDDIVQERDFTRKCYALKWIKQELSKKKNAESYADLKKYNKNNDDFDYWFYKLINNKVVEVLSPEVTI